MTVEQWYGNCPPGIPHAQWENMVDYWQTPEFKESSARNTENREHLTEHHTSGSKSFMRHAYEIQVETNQPATRVDIYGRTYNKSDAGKEKFRKMEALRKKAEENGIVESLQQLDGDSYSQTIGPDKRGRYRGVGNCIKPKKRSRGESSSTSNTDDVLKDLQEHIVFIDQDREELRKVNESLIKSNEETNKKMDNMLEIFKLISPNQ
ncbi:hypothetical protein MKX03_033488, partial [Papaver bracteatum]